MTSPNLRSRPGSDNPLETMAAWFELHSRQVSWGVIGVVAIGGAAWYYVRTQSLKSERAERAYYAAEQSIASGNRPLAESDLNKLITRYDGTAAAYEGRLALTRLLYDDSKFQEGVAALKKAMPKLESSKDFASPAHLLLAAGYEQLKQFLAAANEYGAAAKAARFDPDRQRYEIWSARAYFLGGKVDEAKRIWTELAADSKGTVAGEARVRLGELVARPAPKS